MAYGRVFFLYLVQIASITPPLANIALAKEHRQMMVHDVMRGCGLRMGQVGS